MPPRVGQGSSAIPMGNEEDVMKTPNPLPLAKHAILTLAEIKAAIEAFDRGATNVFDSLDAIMVALEAYADAAQPRRDAA